MGGVLMTDSPESIIKLMITRIEDIGRIKEKMRLVLDNQLFDDLSKHNPYFHSENVLEGDKLDDIRMRLGCLLDQLIEIYEILNQD
jgi:hypothetical protein